MSTLWMKMKETMDTEMQSWQEKKERSNPAESLQYYIKQAERETEKTGALIARQRQLVDTFTKEYEEAAAMLEKRTYQAEVVKEKGNEDFYAFALREKEEYESRTEKLAAMKKETEEQLEQIESKYENMKHRVKDMHIKRLELMGKENVYRVNYKSQKVYNEKENAAADQFSDMERYLDGLAHWEKDEGDKLSFDERVARLEDK